MANCWTRERLADTGRARGALEIAARSTDFSTLLAIAIAWRYHFTDDAGVNAILARAESLASDSAAFLKVAEAYFDGGVDGRREAWDPAGVRRCLAAAVAAGPTTRGASRSPAPSPVARRACVADAIAPRGVAPETALPVLTPLAGWAHRDPRGLFDRLRAASPTSHCAMSPPPTMVFAPSSISKH